MGRLDWKRLGDRTWESGLELQRKIYWLSRSEKVRVTLHPVTRRELLKLGCATAAAELGALLLHGCGGGCISSVLPGPSPCSKLTDIEHVVFLIQENRSFDHYFGSFRGVRGFDDHPSGSNGVFAQPAPPGGSGAVLPFHLDTAMTNAACTNDINHDWGPQHRYWNGGAMDGWASVHAAVDGVDGAVTMGYYTRADLPYY